MREREYQYINKKVSSLNINDPFRSSYADAVKSNLSQLGDPRKHTENKDKTVFKRETETSRRNKEYY